MRRFLALFDEMPDGMMLLQCAVERAGRGEPLPVTILAILNTGTAA